MTQLCSLTLSHSVSPYTTYSPSDDTSGPLPTAYNIPSPTGAPDEEDDSTDFPLMIVVIAGGSVAVVLFLVLCVAITTFICCRCKKTKTIK